MMVLLQDVAQRERVARLHREAVVVDSLIEEPYFFTDEMLALAREMHDGGLPNDAVLVEMERQRSHVLVGSPGLRPAYRAIFEKAGVTAISVTLGETGRKVASFENAVRDLGRWTYRFDECSDLFIKVKRTEDIRVAHRTGRIGIILNFQNLTHIEDDLDNLELFHCLGIRIAQLTYNSQNLLGSGCTERVDGGLSQFGVDAVRRMNELGMAVDLSHSGPATTAGAIAVSRLPVICSHIGVVALSDHPRNKTDDQLRAIADTGGYVGICTVPQFVARGRRATLDDVLDHLEHAIGVAGVEHVGIGTDWPGSDMPPLIRSMMNKEGERPEFGFHDPDTRFDHTSFVEKLEAWSDWRNLTAGMVGRGYSDADIRQLLGENFMRVMDMIWASPDA